jgi:glycosyltransferase involved in cell wall biosynthesis
MNRGLRITPTAQKSTSSLSVDALSLQADQFLQQNDLESAYRCLCEIAGRDTEGAQADVMTGLIAIKLEKRGEALSYFEKALTKEPENFDAGYNLALLEMLNGHVKEAASRFENLLAVTTEKAPLYNDLGVLWLEQDRPRRAVSSFYRALRANPDFSKARNNLLQFLLENNLFYHARKALNFNERTGRHLAPVAQAEIDHWKEIIDQAEGSVETPLQTSQVSQVSSARTGVGVLQGRKLAFFASHRKFIEPVIARLAENNEVRLFDSDSLEQMSELMTWADLAWFEWCDNLAIQATRLPKRCQIICRLHSYEAFTDMPSQVDWNKVDHLVFVNQSVREMFEKQVRTTIPISIIHNGVDLDKFKLPDNKTRSKKIASVGYINYKKNPELLLYCFKKIHQYDPEYSLHIAGTHQDPRIELYFDHFLKTNNLPVFLDGWVEDMASWYADKGLVISTSLFESFHYSIAEGMASGLLPMIHNWYGADYLYPKEFLFNDPDDCLTLLQQFEKVDFQSQIVNNRLHISDRFNFNDKLDTIMQLLASLGSKGAVPVMEGRS